jgi:hypothetical protein
MIYFKAWGHWSHVIVLILAFLVAQTATEGTEVWLAWWTMDVSRSLDLAKRCLTTHPGAVDSMSGKNLTIEDLIDRGMCSNNSTLSGTPPPRSASPTASA